MIDYNIFYYLMTNKLEQNMESVIKVSAPGKIILFGEHAVVYGKPALAGALNLRTQLTLKQMQDELVSLCLPNVGINMSWQVTDLAKLYTCLDSDKASFQIEAIEKIKAFLQFTAVDSKHMAIIAFLYVHSKLTKSPVRSFSITVDSMLPTGAGLGSSAAYAVCVTASLLIFSGEIPSQCTSWSQNDYDLINTWAFEMERIIHGTPSGVDNAVSTYGGVLIFDKSSSPPIQQITPGSVLVSIVVINTKVPRSTKALVSGVREKCDKHPNIMANVLNAIESVVIEAKQAFISLSSGNCESGQTLLNELIDINQNLLNTLGVGHAKLDDVILLTRQYKVHSKLTGAGGGGCAFGILPGCLSEPLMTAVKSKGYDCWQTSVGGPGVTTH